MSKKITVTDTVLRDAHQSLLATRMRTEDMLDIRAYLMTLKPVVAENKPADIPSPFILRRGVGL